MHSTLRATRRRAVAGALAIVALLVVAAGALGDIGRPGPAPTVGITLAGDIGWPGPAPAPALVGPELATHAEAVAGDIGWPSPAA